MVVVKTKTIAAAAVGSSLFAGLSMLGFFMYLRKRQRQPQPQQPPVSVPTPPPVAPANFQPVAAWTFPDNPKNSLYQRQWNSVIKSYVVLHAVYYLCLYLLNRYKYNGVPGKTFAEREKFLKDFLTRVDHPWRQGITIAQSVLDRLNKVYSVENMFLVGGDPNIPHQELMKLYLELQQQHAKLQTLQTKLLEEGEVGDADNLAILALPPLPPPSR